MTDSDGAHSFPRLANNRVFLAAPFTQLLPPEGGRVSPAWERVISHMRDVFMECGSSVFSAHVREQWGAALMNPSDYTPLDFAEMQGCDLVCAFLGAPPSGGVYVELGWASALGKPILLFVDRDTFHSPLIEGLGTISAVRVVQVDDGDYVLAALSTLAELGYLPAPANLTARVESGTL